MVNCPPLNLWAQPELQPPAAEIDYRAGHVGVSSLVLAHRVSVREAEDLADGPSIDELVDVDLSSHASSVHPSAAEPYERKLSVRPVRYLPNVSNKKQPRRWCNTPGPGRNL
jgi:hypothetical protein